MTNSRFPGPLRPVAGWVREGHRPSPLAGAVLVALACPAAAQEAGALAALVVQGRHWQEQNRPDLASAAFDRALRAAPDNPEALAGAVQAQAALGNRAAADALLTRLRRATGQADGRVAAAEAAVRSEAVDNAGLAEARRLAGQGRTAEAVGRYREAFGGATPPEAQAAEFYLTLAGGQAGWDEAREALARRAAQRPNDARAQLALAQVLTYREQSRAEGIARLRRLADDPAVGREALSAWRQSLFWTGTGPAAAKEIEAYAARDPGDLGIAQRLAEARAAPAGGRGGAGEDPRQRGFKALDGNRLPEAAREFDVALAADAADADALGGLGVVRLRQGRAAEARDLLQRAIAAAPSRAGQWQRALDGAAYAAELAEARGQLRAGRATEAEALLRRSLQRDVPDRADAEALLGEALLRRGDATGAEARFRAALARRGAFGEAQAGLERSLRQQGRLAEAEQFATRNRPAGPDAAGLRHEAARAGDPDRAMVLLRSAVATAPSDPWARLDLARLLARQGRAAEGRALMEELAGGRVREPDVAFAAALFAEEQGRPADAGALMEQVPAARRSAAMAALLARTRGAAEVARAAEAARGPAAAEGRNRLLALAGRSDPSGALAAGVVGSFARMGDGAGAEEAGRVALQGNRGLTPGGRLAIAGALLGAGRTEAAQAAIAPLESGALPTEEARQLAELRAGMAVQAADRANARGDQATGFERLRPVLERDPRDPATNLALARLYQGAGRTAEAMPIAEAVLARDPRNMDARTAAVEAALAAGQARRAAALVAEGRSLAPQEPRLLLLEARLARAAGDPRRAERLLEEAAALRRAQTGEDRSPYLIASAAPGLPAATLENPFGRAAAGPPSGRTAPQDAVSDEIARELAAARDEAAPRLSVSPAIRTRSGTGGLDRLQEVSGQAEVSTTPGGMGGKLALRATPVSLATGDLGGELATRRSFGTNALAGPGGGAASRDTTAAGVGLGLAWQRGAVQADVGSTPLGFRTTNAVGGLEFAPRLADNLRLRVTGDRRAVTDSLLSWSGQRDPLTGRTWGGVVRTGGRAQLEYSRGPFNAYAGGGYAAVTGQGVADNGRVEAGAGIAWALYRRPEEELIAGLDLVYFGYDKNLRHFSLGQGGYFSPQSYTAVNLPVDWRGRSEEFSWRLGGTIGLASWRESASPVFPTDPSLQAQLQAAANTDPTLQARYPGRSQTGLTGGVRADLEYRLTPQLGLGTALRYDRAANWNEARGLVYLRYRMVD